MILDTNAISDLFKGDQNLAEHLEKADAIHIPVVVIGEYLFGLQASRHREMLLGLLLKLEEESELLPIDRTTAKHYAQIKAGLKSRGNPIPENDIWIAALALQHKHQILSLDHHFDMVPEIRRLAW